MTSLRFRFLFLAISVLAVTVTAHNITDLLKDFPQYSEFNRYLTLTKIADEINSRNTITVLVLGNGVMTDLVAKQPLSVIKNELSIHVLLDYFDDDKLHQIPSGTIVATNLYQSTGIAPGRSGFVNITDLKGGKVLFGSGGPDSKLDSSYSKSIRLIPYNISVLEIDAPIIAPGVLAATPESNANITALLEKAGCKTFANLLVTSGVMKTYESASAKGLTAFAPSDKAFNATGVPDLKKLTNADVVALLQYHALGGYYPISTLKITKDPISTLASNGAGKFDLTVTAAGDNVTVHTGVGSSRIGDTVLDSTPLAIFTVDSVLLPTELFGKAPSPAPAAKPVPSPSPSPSPSRAPSPAPVTAKAPAPLPASPPAPPTDDPADSPADAPDASDESPADNAAVHVNAPAFFSVVVTVASLVLMS